MESCTQRIRVHDVGIDHWMTIQTITFYESKIEYLRFDNHNHTEFRATLNRRNKFHSKIRAAIGVLKSPPVVRCGAELILLFDRASIMFLHRLLSHLFGIHVKVDTRFYNGGFGFKTNLHPLDLYEMGYFSDKKAQRGLSMHGNMFLGLSIVADSPHDNLAFQFDCVEAVISRRYFSFSIIMHTYLTHYPFDEQRVTKLVDKIIRTMPTEVVNTTDNCMMDWTLQWEMIFTTRKISPEWSPFPFLKELSPILDMFPTYRADSNFVMDFSTEEEKPVPQNRLMLGEKRPRS